MNFLANAYAATGNSLAFLYDLVNNPLFIFVGGLVLLGLFFWYLGSDQDKVKRNAGSLFIIGIASFSLFSLFQQGIKYGIDIAGGVAFTLKVEPNIGDDGKAIALTDAAMEQACTILTDRLNTTGANDVIIRPKKKEDVNLIEVQIPAANPEKLEETKTILTKVAKLQILPVHLDPVPLRDVVKFTLKVEPGIGDDGKAIALTDDAMNEACVVLRQRLDSAGAKNMKIRVDKENANQIEVQIPINNSKQIINTEGTIEAVKTLLSQEATLQNLFAQSLAKVELTDKNGVEDVVPAENAYKAGYKVYKYESEDDNGKTRTEWLFLKQIGGVSGKDIIRAGVDYSRPGHVHVTLNDDGAKKMYEVTSHMRKGVERLAIVLDDVVKSAPTVNDVLSKNFEISGLNAPGEAEALTKVLSNPLTNKLTFESSNEISASLGEMALRQGEYSGVTGLICCFIMVFIYYRFAGFVAILGLTLNALLLLGFMSIFGFELTLPGIAGIVLTLGMAVDANVLIYERLRDEKAAGRPFRIAIRNSFDKAFSAIFDSNLTSLITALILYWMATGTIKGFAVTLSVGIITSMIGAILVTRVLFYWADTVGIMKDVHFLDMFNHKSKFDFMGKRKASAILCVLLLAICTVNACYRGKDALGMDFTGGSSVSYLIEKGSVSTQQVENVLDGLDLTQQPTVREVGNNAEPDKVSIVVNFSDAPQDKEALLGALAKNFPNMAKPDGEETIGQSMGYDTLITSAWALFFGMIGIMIYLTVRFEWTFAVGAVIALAFDVLLVLGLIVLSGTQLNVFHIGSLLTIAGYSINDKIIVFDRIREVLRYYDDGDDMVTIMNDAVNQTLPRTILTSLSTLAVLGCLYFFGGTAMEEFSWTIIAGIVIGTFSSIFVASPAALFFSKKHSLKDEVKKAMDAGA